MYFSEKIQKEQANSFRQESICSNCMNGEFAVYIQAGLCRKKKLCFMNNDHGRKRQDFTIVNLKKYPITECDCYVEIENNK